MSDTNKPALPEPVALIDPRALARGDASMHCITRPEYRSAADVDAGVEYVPVYTADQLRAYGDARSAKAQAEVAALRKALKPFADADLTSPVVRDTFGFDVLRARAALSEQPAHPAPVERVHEQLAEAVRDGRSDADADAARLALELECLLTDKDVPMPALSRWWDSAHEALRLHRERLAATPEPLEFGCCLPEGECCMPGLHFPSECHTTADYERQHGVDWRRADDMRAEHDAEMRRDAFGLP